MIVAKKGKIRIIIGVIFLLASICFVFYIKTPKTELMICSPVSLKGSEEAQYFQSAFMKKGGIYSQVGQMLKERGYEYIIMAGADSKDKILVKFVLINKEATEQRQDKVQEIFNEIIKTNDLDPKIFKVKVSNDSSFYW